MAGNAVIQTHELSKHFRHPLFIWLTKAKALNELTININPGEVYGLLGPNGSGKSTTIKLILGMLWPTSGEVSIFNRRPSDVKVKERIGYLPEESHLYRFLSAEETLDFYGKLFHIPRTERRRRIDSLLELTGLTHERTRPVVEFSKGMQRRVGLAQTLINDPELVILDEPTSGMDPLGTREIKNIILQLKEKKKTVLLSSHLLSDVEDVCDRVGILYGGRMRAEGKVNELLKDNSKTQITAQMDQQTIKEVNELIRKNMGSNEEISVRPPMERLESFFLNVVEKAQLEGVATSGATSKSDGNIDFLTQGEETENILQDLTREEEKQAPAKEEIIPEKVTLTEHNENQELLHNLESKENEDKEIQTPTTHEDIINPVDNGPDTDLLGKLTKEDN